MIIAVDFDGTLQLKNGQANMPLIRKLKQNQQMNDVVILWTCREGKSLIDALKFLKANGFVPSLVNCNHVDSIKKLGHDSRKILADVYIDDKNI